MKFSVKQQENGVEALTLRYDDNFSFGLELNPKSEESLLQAWKWINNINDPFIYPICIKVDQSVVLILDSRDFKVLYAFNYAQCHEALDALRNHIQRHYVNFLNTKKQGRVMI